MLTPLCVSSTFHHYQPTAALTHRATSGVSKHTRALCLSELGECQLVKAPGAFHVELYAHLPIWLHMHAESQYIPVLQLHIKAPEGMKCLLKESISSLNSQTPWVCDICSIFSLSNNLPRIVWVNLSNRRKRAQAEYADLILVDSLQSVFYYFLKIVIFLKISTLSPASCAPLLQVFMLSYANQLLALALYLVYSHEVGIKC